MEQRSNSRRILSMFVVVCLMLVTAHSHAQEDVHFAGVAYLGDYRYIDKNYPLTVALNAKGEDNRTALDKVLYQRLSTFEPEHMRLHFGLADLSKGQSTVLAFAVDKELVSREVYDSEGVYTKLIIDISLQLLFYDFESMALVDNISVSHAINHVYDGKAPPDMALLNSKASEIYLGQGGLFDQALDKLSHYTPDHASGVRFQLNDISIGERIPPFMPEGLDRTRFSQYLGQYFSAELSVQNGVLVLPYSRGYALGNQLPGRFANGEVFSLTLPETDYAFALEIKNFFKRELDGNPAYFTQLYFKLSEPFTQSDYIADDYVFGVFKHQYEGRVETDEWSAYEDAVESLVDDLISQLKHPTQKWHKEHARHKTSYKRFKSKKELFNDA